MARSLEGKKVAALVAKGFEQVELVRPDLSRPVDEVFFFGAEVTRIFATQYGGGIIPHRHTWRQVSGL